MSTIWSERQHVEMPNTDIISYSQFSTLLLWVTESAVCAYVLLIRRLFCNPAVKWFVLFLPHTTVSGIRIDLIFWIRFGSSNCQYRQIWQTAFASRLKHAMKVHIRTKLSCPVCFFHFLRVCSDSWSILSSSPWQRAVQMELTWRE